MSPILISGLINLETTLRVDGFPLEYAPVRYPFFGVNSTVCGVGYNIAKALATLGDAVRLMSIIGEDAAGTLARHALAADGISDEFVIAGAPYTAQSVILYDPDGRRQIHVDLKDIQERAYPEALFDRAAQGCDVAVLCNINFSRPFLRKARAMGMTVATDVHAIADLDDPYNRDFMAAADILFMSDERLPCGPEEWARQVMSRYGPRVVVIGLGAQGALLAVRGGAMERIPAVRTRPVVNTIGAGDALFACFLHFYSSATHLRGASHVEALRKAVVFASYKIGAAGAAEGFLTEAELERQCAGNHSVHHRGRGDRRE